MSKKCLNGEVYWIHERDHQADRRNIQHDGSGCMGYAGFPNTKSGRYLLLFRMQEGYDGLRPEPCTVVLCINHRRREPIHQVGWTSAWHYHGSNKPRIQKPASRKYLYDGIQCEPTFWSFKVVVVPFLYRSTPLFPICICKNGNVNPDCATSLPTWINEHKTRPFTFGWSVFRLVFFRFSIIGVSAEP